MSGQAAERGLRHTAWLYDAPDEYVSGIAEFVRAAADCNEPVLLAVPALQVSGAWPPAGPDVTVVDMRELGGNPARLIPAIRAFADRYQGRRVRYVGEPAWAARSVAELRETARYEALLNRAFADVEISMLCPYNEAELSTTVIADARGAHPTLGNGRSESPNNDYRGPAVLPDSLTRPLLAPPESQALCYAGELLPVRELVEAVAGHAGLSQDRCADLKMAASEVAANTLRHTNHGGVVRLWVTDAEVLCQIEDSGHIIDPLAGHWRPSGELVGGQGLWLVNQVCDLAEIRSSERGTTIRLHMYRR